MAATLMDQATASSNGVVTSIAATLSQALVTGDKLMAFVHHTDDYPVGPAGWTKDLEDAGNSVVQIWSRTIDGTESSNTFTFTAPSPGGMTLRVSRWTGLGAVDNASASGSNLGGSMQLGPTTAGEGTMNFAVVALRSQTLPLTDMTWSNGFAPVAPDMRSTGSGFKSQMGIATFRNTVPENPLTTTATYTVQASTVPEGKMIGYVETEVAPPALTSAELVQFDGANWNARPAELVEFSPVNGWVAAQ